MRCYIFDNHRPVHLANIHSTGNVVVIDDGSIDMLPMSIPSDGSDLDSGAESSSDEDEQIEEENDDNSASDEVPFVAYKFKMSF